MGDEPGKQKKPEYSKPVAKPEASPQSDPDKTAPSVPFIDDPPTRRPVFPPWRPRSQPDEVFPPPEPPFLPDDQSWNTVARQWWARQNAYRRAAVVNTTGGSEVFPPFPPLVDAPGLLLQTVIVPGVRTSEGTLIEAVALPWFDIIDLIGKDPSVAFQLSWDKWEEIIAGAYKQAGFDEVTLTPRSGDYGRDVIAIKRGLGSVRVIDSVKAYKPPYLVKANDVRALIGVLQTDGAAKGFVTTTSDFAPRIRTDPTIIPLIPSRLDLINGEMLRSRLDELARKRK